MKYYVIQVRARREQTFLKRCRERSPEDDAEFFWPRRELRIRKAGVWRDVVTPIFPGYVFLACGALGPPFVKALKDIPDFVRFLRSNQNITPLGGRDLELASHFIRQGEIVKKSLVAFDSNRRVRVVEGPLKGLEGMIIKVDKRKKRIKVKLELYNDSFMIDFGYESVEAGEATGG